MADRRFSLALTLLRLARERRRILKELFAMGGDSVWMQPPFFCDYGSNIELGERVFFNFNCVVLDVCTVRIGSFTMFGPAEARSFCPASGSGRVRSSARAAW